MRLLLAGLLLASTSNAQTPGFEVASIRPTNPATRGRWLKMPPDDNQITVRGMSLKHLIQAAYGLPPSLVVGGPPWADNDRYDMVAKSEGHRIPTQQERQEMLKALIADRFGLKFHLESKEGTVFALVVAKKGSKMKERKDGDGGRPWAWPTLEADSGGFFLPGRNISMPELAGLLQVIIPVMDKDRGDRLVLDKTGLTGRFDFDLQWAGDPGLATPESYSVNVPNFFAALQEQLGLKLETAKAVVETLIIDHAEKPSEN